MEDRDLPRILYYSSVPAEQSFAGATLIYRLLENYPKDKLLIVQGMEINNQGRIEQVSYLIDRKDWLDRIKRTRVGKWINGWLVLEAMFGRIRFKKQISEFKPELILSVSFQLMWVKAFRLSEKIGIPFHILLHDDWLSSENYGIWQKIMTSLFRKTYLQSAGRFCISPNMEEYYYRLFGIRGSIMYPFRGKYDKIYPVPYRSTDKPSKFCYAGSLSTGDFAAMLNEIAKVLGDTHSELHIFSPTKATDLIDYDHLQQPHVRFHGLKNSASLVRLMHEEMDVSIMLNSFEHEEAFRYNFSSKLVDYTSAGLPILMWGPSTSGAIVWGLHNEYPMIVTENSYDQIKEMIARFALTDLRWKSAELITRAGQSQFSYEMNFHVFQEKLVRT